MNPYDALPATSLLTNKTRRAWSTSEQRRRPDVREAERREEVRERAEAVARAVRER